MPPSHSHSHSQTPSLRPAFPAPRLPKRLFLGPVISSRSPSELAIHRQAALGVGSSGIIRFVVEDVPTFLAERQRKRDEHAPEGEEGEETETGNDGERSATPVQMTARSNTHPAPAPSETVPVDAKTQEPSTHNAEEELPPLRMPPPAVNNSSSNLAASHPELPPALEVLSPKDRRAADIIAAEHGWKVGTYSVLKLKKGSFLCPGFIDTHTHACQVPNIGLGQQYELLDWLKYVTFPREKQFEDLTYARRTYESVVQRLIDSGTTTACYYATLHLEATKILAEVCNERGQRAFVGKCQMDRNSPLDYIEKNASVSMEDTKELIAYCRQLRPYGAQNSITASPALTPMSSSPELDASIQRLSRTMDEVIAESNKKDSGEAAPTKDSTKSTSRPTSSDSRMQPVRTSSSSSVNSQRSSGGGGGGGSGTVSPTVGTSAARQKEAKEREWQAVNALVQPILTPRFAISCTDAMLASISALLSRDPTLRVQTHLSESVGEIEAVRKLFPFAASYTDVYEHYALLGPRTILAHAIHLSDDELELIRKRKAGVSHCPTSNFNLRSGTSKVGEMLNRGIKVGLGTDVSGGFGLGMLSAIREASVVAKVVDFSAKKKAAEEGNAAEKASQDPDALPVPVPTPAPTTPNILAPTDFDAKIADGRFPLPPVGDNVQPQAHVKPIIDYTKAPLPIATLFYLATLGGAELCCLQGKIGTLDAGKEFDALLISTTSAWGPRGYTGSPNLYIEPEDTLEDVLEKFLFCADDRNIHSVFVRGRVVGGAQPIA